MAIDALTETRALVDRLLARYGQGAFDLYGRRIRCVRAFDKCYAPACPIVAAKRQPRRYYNGNQFGSIADAADGIKKYPAIRRELERLL